MRFTAVRFVICFAIFTFKSALDFSKNFYNLVSNGLVVHLQKWEWLEKFHEKWWVVFGLRINFLSFVFDTSIFEWFWAILNQFYYFSMALCCLEIRIILFEFFCVDSRFKQFSMNSNVSIRSSNNRVWTVICLFDFQKYSRLFCIKQKIYIKFYHQKK